MVDSVMTSPSAMPLLRLCQLVSPALPIGAYNFSQGLEWAVQRQWVHDQDSTQAWLDGLLRQNLTTLDVPMLLRLYDAWQQHDVVKVRALSQQLLAHRDSSELRAEERHLGRALAKVLVALDVHDAQAWTQDHDATYAALFALAASQWQISARTAATAYLWAWCENQVMAALKLLPLGQTAGQRILSALLPQIETCVANAHDLHDDDIGVSSLQQGMACAWHETQYSRLFRS